MNREMRHKLRRLPREVRRVQITDPGVRIVKTSPRDGGVRIEARQGVWTHSFIRNHCGLDFKIHS
jgi:hypothetical protein